MKRTVFGLLMTIGGVMVTVGLAFGATSSDVTRAGLIDSKATEIVYTVDEYHSFVVGDAALLTGGGLTVVKHYGAKEGLPENSYLVRHSTPQPFMYKGGLVPPYEEVGELKGTIKTAEAALGSDGRYGILDLYEHANALCQKKGGRAVYVIPKRNGRYKLLTEVRAEEAFDYILHSAGGNGAWYMACEGDERFLVTKNYTFKGSLASVDVIPGRGLEGVDYVKDGYKVPQRTVVAEEKPLNKAEFLKKMAWEVASVRNDFLKPGEGARYLGFYNGPYNSTGCEWVSVKQIDGARVPGRFTAKIYDFKVCGDKVASLGQSEETVVVKNLQDLYKRPVKGMLARNGR